ncbi:MAG: RNA polymerase sigma factor [Ruminiclostridium sp.]|nr:RNA polymerase sigma factor [Ruminiclostridium sp.]
MNDEKIIELYFARSEDAITETDRKYGDCCRNTAYNILGNHEDTEECVNDTYMKVWNVIPPQRPAKLGSFVMRIVRNLAIDIYKKRNAVKNRNGYNTVSFDEISEFLPVSENVESIADGNAVLKAVESFLQTLPRDKRIMFVRRYFYCSKYGDIAKELHTTEGNVTVTLRRIREKLRSYLEKEGIEI